MKLNHTALLLVTSTFGPLDSEDRERLFYLIRNNSLADLEDALGDRTAGQWATMAIVGHAMTDPEKVLACGVLGMGIASLQDLGVSGVIAAVLNPGGDDDWTQTAPSSDAVARRVYKRNEKLASGAALLEEVFEAARDLETDLLNAIDGYVPGDQGTVDAAVEGTQASGSLVKFAKTLLTTAF